MLAEDNEEFRDVHVTLLAEQASVHRQILLRIFQACTPVVSMRSLQPKTLFPTPNPSSDRGCRLVQSLACHMSKTERHYYSPLAFIWCSGGLIVCLWVWILFHVSRLFLRCDVSPLGEKGIYLQYVSALVCSFPAETAFILFVF